jgi:hypothetical protein
MMTSAAQVIDIARKDVGLVEGKNNDSKFGRWYGMNHEPYCAMAVSYWFAQAGMPLHITTDKGFAYCPYGVKFFRDRGQFSKTPHVGDIVFYDWQGDGVSDHTGIVIGVSGRNFTAIEANTSPDNRGSQSNGGGVYIRTRPISSALGFGHVVYDARAWKAEYRFTADSVARRFGITIDELQAANPGQNIKPGILKGVTINVPVTPTNAKAFDPID